VDLYRSSWNIKAVLFILKLLDYLSGFVIIGILEYDLDISLLTFTVMTLTIYNQATSCTIFCIACSLEKKESSQ